MKNLFFQNQTRGFLGNINTQSQSVVYHVERKGVRTEKQILDNFKDIRSGKKAYKDQADGIRREELVMSNLSAIHFALGADGHFEKIDSFEKSGIDTVSQRKYDKPDYYYHLKRPGERKYIQYTYEIKCNSTEYWTDETVFIKRPSIWSMNNKSDIYPNGRLIISTKSKFATMSARDVARYPQEVTETLGGKITFHIPEEHFEWRSWLVPIEEW